MGHLAYKLKLWILKRINTYWTNTQVEKKYENEAPELFVRRKR